MKRQSNLSRLMEYAGGYRYLSYSSWALSGISALVALVPFWYIWKIIRQVLETAPDFSQAQDLTRNGWMAVGFAVLSVLIYIAGLMCSHIAAFRVAGNIRRTVMGHIVSLPLGMAERFGSGRLRKIVNESSAATETYLAHQLPDKAGSIAMPCGLLVLLLIFDWRLGLFSLIPVALSFLIMIRMTGEKMMQRMTQYQNALDDMSNEAVEYVRGIPVIKTFGQTIFSFRKFKGSIDRYVTWISAHVKAMRMPMLFYTVAANSSFVFLMAAGVFFTQGSVTKPFLLNLLFYIILTPIISLMLTRIMYQSEHALVVNDALRRIDSVLSLTPLSEPIRPEYPKDSSVVVEDVSFSYGEGAPALRGVSLTIQPGQTVAFVGPSGGGKTTIASLISRFFDPQQGRILIGGVDIRSIPKKKLMEMVSFVFQDSHLIKASILENVRMGRQSADRTQVMAALKAAQCMDIIEKLPDGVDTVIGSHGVYLSGGEQQRIAIARVLLKDTPIVILDEATAFADPDNESRVQAAFSQLSKGKTVILIAHRLTTVTQADRIFVLKDGQIAESGNARELMAADGDFHKMWNNYQTSVQWNLAKET